MDTARAEVIALTGAQRAAAVTLLARASVLSHGTSDCFAATKGFVPLPESLYGFEGRRAAWPVGPALSPLRVGELPTAREARGRV